MRTLGRILWVPIAFALAVAMAIFMLLSLGSERLTQALKGNGLPEDSLRAMLELAGQAVHLVSALSIVPALLLVIVGEVARIRSWLYYVVGSGAALAAVPMIARVGSDGALAMPAIPVLQVFATAGFAGGFVYWLLAGRSA